MLAVLTGLWFVKLAPGGDARVAMFVEGTIAGLVGAYGLWRFGLADGEREMLSRKLGGKLRRKPAPAPAKTP
jgi:hypothetical protein